MLRIVCVGEGKKGAPWHDNVLIEQHKNNLYLLMAQEKDISYYTSFFSMLR